MEHIAFAVQSFRDHNQFLAYPIRNLTNFFIIITLIATLVLFSNSAYGATTVTVGHNPYQVAVDPTINRAYTSNQADNTVSVIDGSTNNVIATIPVGSGPVSVVVDTTTHRIYTANQGSATVSVIDGTPGSPTENTVISTIPVGSGPAGVGIDEITHRVYVGNVFSGTASVIDGTPGSPTENTVISTIPLGGTATRIGVDPVLKKVYVTNSFSNKIFVIDSITNTLTSTITVGAAPVEAAVDISSGLVYTANRASNTVSVIDGATNAVLSTIPIANGPNGLAIDKNNNKLYVSNILADTISIVDINTNTLLGTIPVANDPGGIGFNPTTNLIYVAHRADTVVVVLDALAPILPTANAGIDQVVNEGDFVNLKGTGTGSGSLSFTWTQTSGPSVTLSDPNIKNPTFTAPQVGSTTLLTFELVVNDDFFTSDPDTVNVVVKDKTTFTVPLVPTGDGLSGSVNVGDIDAGTTINLQLQSPPGVLPIGELKQTLVSTGIDGNDVSFDFTVNSEIAPSLPPLPLETALFFDIETHGIDFSNPSNLPPNQLPNSRFLLSTDFPTQDTFSDGCPVVSFYVLDESLGTWEQLGQPIIPNTNKIYAANIEDDSVSVIDGATNAVEATIPVPGGVHHLSFDRDSNSLYVTNPFSNTVSVIDMQTNNIISTIPVGNGAHGVFNEPISKKIYVSNRGSDTVTVIDSTTNTVITNIHVGSGPVYTTVNTNTNRIYSANFFSNDVSVIDSLTNTVIDTIPNITLSGGIDVDLTTNRVYVSNLGSSLVSVIDGTPGSPTENTVIASIPVGGSPSPVVIDPNSNKIYVGNTSTDTVSVIDKSVNAVIDTIHVGDSPRFMSINTNTNRVYVTNFDSNDVTVIDGSTLSVIDTIQVGNGPNGISLNPDVPNPVRDPSTDVIDSGTGDILQCAYLGKQPHLSKFAVGGIIRALAIGALAGGGGSHGSPASFGSSSLAIISGGEEGFGGIINNQPNTLDQTQTFKVGEKAELRFDFTEGGGIGKIEHIGLFANIRDGQKKYDSDTYISYDPLKSPQVSIHDPNGLFSEATFQLLQKDTTNFVLKYDLTFAKPMQKSDLILESWNTQKWLSTNKISNAIEVVSSGIVQEQTPPAKTTFEEDIINDHVIPVWVKSNAKWWSDGTLDNHDFISGIEYLVNEGIIKVPATDTSTGTTISDIQPWIKNNAGWWADDMISDDEFVTAIQWLISNNIIKVA